MTKVTIVKRYRNMETLRVLDLSEVVRMIQSCEYDEAVRDVMGISLYTELRRQDDGSVWGASNFTDKVPRVCFASVMENRNRQRVRKAYTGLVLLEVNNLTCHDEAVAIRQGAALMPQTLLAFVGASGRSVKIVCRGELFEGGLPETEEDIRLFHLNLYEKARMVYNAQLGVTVDKLEPGLERTCYLGIDTDLYYAPMAHPFYTDTSDLEKALKPIQPKDPMPDNILPGRNRYSAQCLVFGYNLSKAYDDVMTVYSNDNDERDTLVVTRLAEYCRETGLDMAFCRRQTLMSFRYGKYPEVVTKIFENAYSQEHEKQYYKRKNMVRPTKNIPQETLLMMKIDIFLNSNYELRKNVMRGVAEYRMRTGIGFSFQDLTEEARNSITMRAMEQGIKCWDKDIRRFINSDDIERYDPMNDYLENLPRWDGKDRVTALAERVPTEWEEWTNLFHIWMRSMVAMWLGKGQLTGNALVPLLIGRQGCGKSSFCRILLPRDLQEYYNDRINFKNEQDLNLGLTSFALINLDEFDKITQRQQILLKYLVSTADLKYRPPYGKAYTSNRRYASFIGTTNDQTPLTDPSGSRRFVCVSINGDIDFETPVQHSQIFAQLKQEIRNGERYWLTKDEERRLMEHNLQYQRMNGLGEMLMSLIQKPRQSEEGQWISLKELSTLLKKHFKGYKEEPNSFQKIGNYLNRPEYKFQSKHAMNGTLYWIKKRVE